MEKEIKNEILIGIYPEYRDGILLVKDMNYCNTKYKTYERFTLMSLINMKHVIKMTFILYYINEVT